MAGEEESRARAILTEMQMRISQGPHSALGVGEAISPEQVRSAFLELTKQFHPARFGRMSADLQRLSNEVFLGIKFAHDQLMKSLGSPLRPQSSGIPHVAAEGTTRTPAGPATVRGTGLIPRQTVGTQPPATHPVQFARGTDRTTPQPSTPVPPGTQPGVQPRPITLTPGAERAPGAPPAQPRPTPGMQPRPFTPVPPGTQPGVQPASARPVTPGRANSPSTSPVRPGTPQPTARITSQSIPIARPTTPGQTGRTPALGVPTTERQTGRTPALGVPTTAGSSQPLPRQTPPTSPPRPNPDAINPPTIRYSGQPVPSGRTQPLQPAAPVFDEQLALNDALGLIRAQNWTGARQALHALAAKIPQSKPYRALLCYTRGREAHAGGRGDEALLEYQRALQLDPELAVAKQAIAELQRRR